MILLSVFHTMNMERTISILNDKKRRYGPSIYIYRDLDTIKYTIEVIGIPVDLTLIKIFIFKSIN